LPSLTVENYVKEIYKLCSPENRQRATTGRLATALNVSPGTVTSMLKTLNEAGLATYTPYEGVQLSPEGNELALRILRRHRLLETFLAEVLGLDWDEVHEDAERMEHVVSDRLIDTISDYLGHPEFDPHGDPIPTRELTLASRETSRLAECPSGCQFSLAQVTDQSPEFLRYLRQIGLGLGQEGEVVANQPEAGTVTVRVDSRELTLGQEAAQKLLVTTAVAGAAVPHEEAVRSQ
jgi:DtxR family Mn-dependent transcriptional regulator